MLAKQLLDGATADMTIGVLSAPSAFVALKNILVSVHNPEQESFIALGNIDMSYGD